MLWRPSSKMPTPSFHLNRTGTKFGRNVLEANTHRLTRSDSLCDVILSIRPWRHFMQKTEKSVATWWVHTQRLPGAYAATSTLQFATHSWSTFALTLVKFPRFLFESSTTSYRHRPAGWSKNWTTKFHHFTAQGHKILHIFKQVYYTCTWWLLAVSICAVWWLSRSSCCDEQRFTKFRYRKLLI